MEEIKDLLHELRCDIAAIPSTDDNRIEIDNALDTLDKIYNKIIKSNNDDEMVFNMFKSAHDILNYIIVGVAEENVIYELENQIKHIEFKDDHQKIKFLSHLNALFLHILLNELSTYGQDGEKKSITCRQFLKYEIYKLRM
jgi:hypothetical protein